MGCLLKFKKIEWFFLLSPNWKLGQKASSQFIARLPENETLVNFRVPSLNTGKERLDPNAYNKLSYACGIHIFKKLHSNSNVITTKHLPCFSAPDCSAKNRGPLDKARGVYIYNYAPFNRVKPCWLITYHFHETVSVVDTSWQPQTGVLVGYRLAELVWTDHYHHKQCWIWLAPSHFSEHTACLCLVRTTIPLNVFLYFTASMWNSVI